MWPPLDLLALALALSMDAVAVALARGAAVRPPESRLGAGMATGLAFGTAQGLMPLLGLAAAGLFTNLLAGPSGGVGGGIGPIIAFLILLVLGIRMIREGLSADPPEGSVRQGLIMAALATSIDAAAAGATLPLFDWPVLASALLIGAVTAALSLVAVIGGAMAGARLGRRADLLGGCLLILIGARILLAGG